MEYMCRFMFQYVWVYYLREFKRSSEKIMFWTFEASYIIWASVFRFGIKITNYDSKERITA